MIDGRRMVEGRGTRDMPVWGDEFTAQAFEYYTDYPFPYDPESFVRGRILALTGYIYQLQDEQQQAQP